VLNTDKHPIENEVSWFGLRFQKNKDVYFCVNDLSELGSWKEAIDSLIKEHHRQAKEYNQQRQGQTSQRKSLFGFGFGFL